MSLTNRQQAIANYIRDYCSTMGYGPAVRDVAAFFGISPNGAQKHIGALLAKGSVVRTPHVARSLRVVT